MLLLLAMIVMVMVGGVSCEVYSNSWAVEIVGGDVAADLIAKRHGFVNLGRVSDPTRRQINF